jgi:UDP-N-acetylmuramoyl-tripeptide--D-alanyl-D-alanine ligase
VPLLGNYKTHTALAALSVGTCFGMRDEQMNAGLARLSGEPGRLMRLPGRGGTTLIDDTYNASLSSTLAALAVLHQQPASRRIALLGDMLELGSTEEAAHRAVLQDALAVADMGILVGPRLARAAQELAPAQRQHFHLFADVQAALMSLQAGSIYQASAGDVLLFKGSAGIRMERLVRCLLSPELDPDAVLVRQEANWRE